MEAKANMTDEQLARVTALRKKYGGERGKEILLKAGVKYNRYYQAFDYDELRHLAESTGTVYNEELMYALAFCDDAVARMLLAKHRPFLPLDAILILAHDQEEYVRYGLASVQPLPLELFWELYHSGNRIVKIGLVINPITPYEILSLLAEDEYTAVRNTMASRSCTPEDLLRKLASDSDDEVRFDAKNTLQRIRDELWGRLEGEKRIKARRDYCGERRARHLEMVEREARK